MAEDTKAVLQYVLIMPDGTVTTMMREPTYTEMAYANCALQVRGCEFAIIKNCYGEPMKELALWRK